MDAFINTSVPLPDGVASPQFALLNYFFPGFSVLTSALHTYLGIDLNFYLPLLLALCGLNFVWGYVSDSLWSLTAEHLMSSFRVRTNDEMYGILMLWISRQKFSRNSRRFLVNMDLSIRQNWMWGGHGDEDEDDWDWNDETPLDSMGPTQPLHYTPAFGSHLFWYKGHPLLFERHENQQQNLQTASEREEISISCFGRNPRILKELLLEARQMHVKKDECKTIIYRSTRGGSSEPYWQRSLARPNRPFSTVILNEEVKQSLIDDAADYLNPATRRWYANRGIPYRRGYLLHGPPGTGKSSLSLALAGYFRVKIYIVSLNSINATEEALTSLFSSLPTRCLVLLEDIDTAGLTHTREEPDKSSNATATSEDTSSTGRLSLSGLLNILDGVASQEGRLLIMTTNHIEKLDKALIRPGRVDMIVPFSLADATMTEAIFRAIYAPFEGETPCEVESSSSGDSRAASQKDDPDEVAKKHAKVIARIAGLAREFAAKIPEHEFSPAEIQGLLLRHKLSPERVIEAAAEWVVQTRKDKKEKEIREAEERRKEKEEEERKKEEEERKTEEKKEEEKTKEGRKKEEEKDEEK